MRLAAVVSCVDAPELASECLHWLRVNSSPQFTEIVLVDNGSREPLDKGPADHLIRFHENIGGNAVFHDMIPHLDALGVGLVAYLHCDMMVRERGWDLRVLDAFHAMPRLALAGFVASYEVDELGGRGSGTMLNYIGAHYHPWGKATTAEQHGMRQKGVRAAAVLDHCSMIFRLDRLKQIPPQRGHYAPGHFYDRICCAEVIQRGWHLAHIGIECDHFSGGVAGGVVSQLQVYKRWLEEEGIPYEEDFLDSSVYRESERRFLNRFRDGKPYRLVPYKVYPDYSVVHYEPSPMGGWREVPYATTV